MKRTPSFPPILSSFLLLQHFFPHYLISLVFSFYTFFFVFYATLFPSPFSFLLLFLFVVSFEGVEISVGDGNARSSCRFISVLQMRSRRRLLQPKVRKSLRMAKGCFMDNVIRSTVCKHVIDLSRL